MSPPGTETSKKPTQSLHLRVWTDVLESLEDEVKTHRVSPSTVVNQVLVAHTRDDWVLQELGYVKMPKETYSKMLQRQPEVSSEEFSKYVVSDTERTIMATVNGAVDIDAVLDGLRHLSRWGWFSIREATRGEKAVVT